jgi:hypothetical protein
MSSAFISSTLTGSGRGGSTLAAAGGGAAFLGTTGTALVTLGRPPAARATAGAAGAELDVEAVFFMSRRAWGLGSTEQRFSNWLWRKRQAELFCAGLAMQAAEATTTAWIWD